jgi:hypothetical protein
MNITGFLQNLGLIPQMPLLHISTGDQQFSVTNPNLKIYIGSTPPAPEKDLAILQFSEPFSQGAKVKRSADGSWLVYPPPTPLYEEEQGLFKLIDGRGRKHFVRYSVPTTSINTIHHPLALPEGLNRLIFGDREISLLVPTKSLLNGGQTVYLSGSQLSAERVRRPSKVSGLAQETLSKLISDPQWVEKRAGRSVVILGRKEMGEGVDPYASDAGESLRRLLEQADQEGSGEVPMIYCIPRPEELDSGEPNAT